MVRSVVLALLIVCGFAGPGMAAGRAGAAIVLELPPSMPPAAVRALLVELVAKGAKPVASPADPVAATPRMTSSILAARLGRATLRALRAFPTISEAPRLWVERVVAGGGTAGAALCFWIVALGGLAAPPLIGRGVRAVLEPLLSAGSEPMLASRLRAAAKRFVIALAALAIFGLVFWTALLGVASGNRIIEETADRLVWAALRWRLAIIALITVFCVDRRDLRLVVIGDADARTCVRWFSVYAALNPLNQFAVWLVERIGFPQQTVFGVALVLGAGITAYKPEIGVEFIQPLKLQGVIDVLQNALVVRCKFTATPTRPTYLQRQALRRLIDAFTAAGIRFAAPNVMVQLAAAG
jgi:hypothetical protein